MYLYQEGWYRIGTTSRQNELHSLGLEDKLRKIMSVFVPIDHVDPIFFRLPKAVLVNFLSKWLDMQSVGRLDAAMTMRALRPTFLQHLQEMRSTTVDGHTICENGKSLESFQFLAWLSYRRIYVEEIIWKLTAVPSGSAFVMENLKLPFLRKLEVKGYDFESNLIHLVKASPALQSITIGHGVTAVDEILRQIADHCPLLEELEPFFDYTVDDLLYLFNKCSALTKFSLRAVSTWEDSDWVRLRPFGHLMHEISVYGEGQVSNPQAFADFVGDCPRLHKLWYVKIENGNFGIVLLRVAQSCPLLESLNIDTFSSAALLELSRNCKKLREVFISQSDQQSLSAGDLEIFSQIETVEKLMLFQNDLTNEHLAAISVFPNLKHLYFNWYDEAAIFADGTFADTPISRSLEQIGFHVPLVVPVAALSCLMPCKILREIDLRESFCDKAGLKILATHFPLLEKITMGYVKEHIVGLTFFIAQCQHLKEVGLSNAMDDINPNDEEARACFQGHLNDLRSYFPHIEFFRLA